ncbi:MAG: CBS domain containing-hemolysin-like protein [Sulfurimonas sp.]|jgi:CBS domain containing-hemolysin-like protein|uniref:CNNM domain-containing protein n=1 Tax=Sulfurimonas sp. TaxID=2022749 RepID=UPI0039E58D8A
MLLILYFFIAVGISFLCSILESVLLSLTPAYIASIKNTKPKTATLLKNQKKDIEKSIGAILTLNTFAHTLGAAGVGAEAVKIFGEEYMFYISAFLTLLILIFSEIIPKTIGAYYWKDLSGISARLINVLIIITYPLLTIMKHITTLISPKDSSFKNISKEELEATVSLGEEAGLLKENDSLIIENILALNKIKVKDIHTPRSVMFCLSKENLEKSFDKNSDVILNLSKLKEYSRVPIYEENIDNIVGIIFSKEYFYEYTKENRKVQNKLIKPVFKINENIPVSKLLDMFITKKEHMFIVVDNYDQTEGIVTLEDAIETLLGKEIVDEFDKNIDMRELAKNKK